MTFSDSTTQLYNAGGFNKVLLQAASIRLFLSVIPDYDASAACDGALEARRTAYMAPHRIFSILRSTSSSVLLWKAPQTSLHHIFFMFSLFVLSNFMTLGPKN